MPIDFEAVVKARTGRNKVTLQVLGGDTPPNQLTQVSVTTATSDSVSLLPNTSMPQVLAHALRTPLPTPCKSTGRDMTAIFPIGSACDRFIPAIPRLRIGGISSITACFGWAIFFLQESYSRPKHHGGVQTLQSAQRYRGRRSGGTANGRQSHPTPGREAPSLARF